MAQADSAEVFAAVERLSTTTAVRPERLESIDIVRGLVMVIMAIDHTRDYFTYLRFPPESLRHTYYALFFTRWITHFCAPTFIFLSGASAFLSLSKKRGLQVRQVNRPPAGWR